MTAQSDASPANNGTKVVQITNIAPQATKDQMQTLFGFLGKIEDIRLYPTIRDVSVPVQSRICYVKFFDPTCVGVAQHMTNTVFIDRALIVTPYQSSAGEIPDEYRALDIAAQANIVPGLYPSDPKLPPHVTNQIEGIPPNQVITTHDPLLVSNGLPPYPPLPVTYDARRIEEIRRTLLVINIDNSISAQQLIDFFGTAGDVKYIRFCTRDNDSNRYALIEFSEQSSIIPGLKMNGTELAGKMIQVYHATQAIAKPMAKSNEAAQREIEEAMTRVKEAQSLISAAIDPVIGILSKDKKRSRSGSKSRRSRSRSRGRRHRRSRSRSHHRSRHHRRSRSRSKRRSRSRSKPSRSRRSRSRDKRRRSSRERRRSRSRSRSKSKRSRRSSSRRRTRSKSKSQSVKSRSEKSKSDRKSKDREKKRDKDKKSEDSIKIDKSTDIPSKTSSIKSEGKDSDSEKLDSDSKKAKSVSISPDKKIARSRSQSRGDSGSPNRRSSSVSPSRRRLSRSPIHRGSHSPSSRSPVRRRSRSPRKLSRSPIRKRSTSHRRSRSSGRKGSRSPVRRSPGRYRGSRSASPPPRRRSRSGSP
ncbi:probable splicing factor, arginine/serine-rich 7 [Homalodisca vitripennis]|uniref:RRM domain-containing protein n=1 Tax=Homalodisca liturata TaxID=320908 RepID=A0A1B6HUI2_9HEMI|nr:probable splicing factor, arginine/serine-rich 7 [Homalodisca vitripennis]